MSAAVTSGLRGAYHLGNHSKLSGGLCFAAHSGSVRDGLSVVDPLEF